jgi:hypothetical protein
VTIMISTKKCNEGISTEFDRLLKFTNRHLSNIAGEDFRNRFDITQPKYYDSV